MEFHESCVESFPRLRLPAEITQCNPLGGLPDEQQAGYNVDNVIVKRLDGSKHSGKVVNEIKTDYYLVAYG